MHSHSSPQTRSVQPRRLACAAVLIVVLSLAATLASPVMERSYAAPNAQQQYGMLVALVGNNSNVKAMGYSWVQYGAYWKDAETSPGVYNWGHVDNIVNAARSAGLNVLVRVSRPPQWERDPACATVDTCPPRDAAALGRFAFALSRHVRDIRGASQVAYEIWNEPNTSDEWGDMCPDPSRYADLLRNSYSQFKSGDSGARVVAGAVTTVGQRGLSRCFLDDISFLEGMYQAGAAPYFDVLSDHPYGFASPPEADPASGGTRLVFRRAEQHRLLMVRYGDAAKQIWATEMGWALDPASIGSTCARPDWFYIFTPQQQADYLVRAHNWARSYWPWMGVMFEFNYDFKDAPWYDNCHAFRFWSVKGLPAESALRQSITNPAPTYTPVVGTATPTPLPTEGPDAPPTISSVRYSQPAFNREGGTLTVEVDASDGGGSPIESVQTIVEHPGGSTQLFYFDLVAGNRYGGTWRLALPIGANAGNATVTYKISPFVVESFPARRTVAAPIVEIAVTSTRFWDVDSEHWATSYVEFLAARGVISGYGDGSFRPNNSATRGQLSKIVTLGFNMPTVTPAQARFADVPVGSTFFPYVETLVERGLVSGYPCGGAGEPCDPLRRPYFRPNANVTRGQIAKIIVGAAGWQAAPASGASFQDVPAGSSFHSAIEVAVAQGIIGGYPCGASQAEPCSPGDNRPYYRPGNNATRAQIAKMVYLAITTTLPSPSATASTTVSATPTP